MAQDITISPLPQAEAVAQTLIAEHHTDLVETRLLWLVTDGKCKCQPKVLAPFERYLSSALEEDAEPSVTDGYDLVCVVNETDWAIARGNGTDAALVDHLLSHIERHVDDDEQVTYKIVKHPIEEFPDVVHRHGLWNGALREFGVLARQLPLPTPARSDADGMQCDDVRRQIAAAGLGQGADFTRQVGDFLDEQFAGTGVTVERNVAVGRRAD